MTTNMPSEVQVVEVNVLFKSGKKLIFHMALKNLDTEEEYYTIEELMNGFTDAFCEDHAGAEFVALNDKDNKVVGESLVVVNRNDISAITVGKPKTIKSYEFIHKSGD